MRIPEHIIDQIRTQADIVDIIGEHVRLKRSGRNYLGLCPFHKEKTPSFNVNAERGMYKCFGCGKGGNVITFVQEHLHMPFPDAVKHLAAKMHIEIPEEEAADSEEVARREGARAALREAARFYQDTLTTSDGAPARAFFEKRGFSAEIIERFALGASPAAWDAATKHLLANGFTQDHLEDAGLVVVKEDGSVYDRFRGRAMFSIRDDAGRVVGFSARQIVDDPKSGKYINSPQSLLFDKSRVVYGLDLAKRAIMEARTAIIVEGQADVIAMHQAGFTSTVASSGTALTTEHLIRLKRYADTIVMVFDSDAAGQSAMTKGVELCLAAGLDARCVVLPQGEDPDSFLQGAGSDAMKKALADARPWLEWQTERYRLAGDLDDPVRHAAAVRTILTWIAGVPDKLRHPFLVREVAKQFALDETLLMRELPSPQAPYQRQAVPQRTPRVATTTASARPLITPPEAILLMVALTDEHGLPMLLNLFNVEPEEFLTEKGRSLFEQIILAEHEHSNVGEYLTTSDVLSDDDRALIISIIGRRPMPSVKWKDFDVEIPDRETARSVRDALLTMELERTAGRIMTLTEKINDAVNDAERKRTVHQIQQLIEQREELRKHFEQEPTDTTWRSPDRTSVS